MSKMNTPSAPRGLPWGVGGRFTLRMDRRDY